MKEIFIGTSGFSYKHWKGKFYPEELPASQQLEYYAEHFNSVEINSTFYHLPKSETFKSWLKRTPENFSFTLKGNRYITRFLALKNTKDAIDNFFEPAAQLKSKLAMVLWQLPPSLRFDPERLENFINDLLQNKTAKKTRHAFEFRHASWFHEEIFFILKKNNCGFVIADSTRYPGDQKVTSDFVYLRFHGKPRLFVSNYSDESLKEWAAKARKWARGKDLFAYFNNDARGYAIPNAKTFESLLK